MSSWIFQANPRHFDIDEALAKLSQIRWRVPQYTSSIVPGDAVVLWRSGKEAGIVGVGRVIGAPADLAISADEQPFVLEPTEEGHTTTRVPLAILPVPFISKAQVAAIAGWSGHQILTAPMGTVFPIDAEAWAGLEPLLPDLPAYDPADVSRFTPAFSWEQRRKDVYPMPGGYQGYLASLEVVLSEVASSLPTREELDTFFAERLGVSPTSARFSVGFLLRTSLLQETPAGVVLSPVAATWIRDRDPLPVIALIHSRVRFVGEFLAEIAEPKTDTELLEIANQHYGMGWQTKAQIRRRRGWLESAGTMAETADGRLSITEAGTRLLEYLEVKGRSHERVVDPDPPPPILPPIVVTDPSIAAVIARLHETANNGTDPDAFERETAEAFRLLGFESQWIGGAGQTDVLLEAPLGKHASYRVVVDCKSTSRGTVSQQIDWDTIDEHRIKHRADYAVIVAPGFGGGRLAERAERHEALMLTVDDLSELLIQHQKTPLSLHTYRSLFTAATTETGMTAVGEAAQEVDRRAELMVAILDLLDQYGPQMGALSARDLMLLLMTSDGLPDATEQEVDEVINGLNQPLLGIVDLYDADRVTLTGSRETAAKRLRSIADRLLPPADAGSV